MKRTFSAILCLLLIASAFVFVGCDKKDETVKLGLGLHTATKVANATEDANGKAQATMTVAAVTLDAAGKILACQLDTADYTVAYTADGKAVANDSFKTKYEMGKDYNLVAYGNAAKEWFEQADAFEGVVAGKTIDEVKALVVNNYRGNDAVIAAGCTIGINDLVLAVEKAVANAKAEVAADAKLRIGVAGQQAVTEASAEKNAGNKLTANIFIAAVDAAGKVLASSTDCVEYAFSLKDGKVEIDNKDGLSKRNKGDGYNMVAYGKGSALDGGDVKNEWYVQANAFDAACVGKTGAEIAGLMLTEGQHAGRGIDSLQAAGCTIYVSGFVAAAAKI